MRERKKEGGGERTSTVPSNTEIHTFAMFKYVGTDTPDW